MENANLALAAKLMKCTEESLTSFPENVQNAMVAILAISDPKTEDEYRAVTEKLHDEWERGVAYNDMVRISTETDIPLDTLLQLDVKGQLALDFEYTMDVHNDLPDKEIYAHLQMNIQKGIAVAELPQVAELLGIPYDVIRARYPREVWEQLCGAYSMLLDEDMQDNRENIELMDELRAIIAEADKKQEEN